MTSVNLPVPFNRKIRMNRNKTATTVLPSVVSDSPDAREVEDKTNANWLAVVEESVRGLRFGVVQITIHEGKVVHIDRTERTKLDLTSKALISPAKKI